MINIIVGLIASLIYVFSADAVSIPITIGIFAVTTTYFILVKYAVVLFTVLRVIAKNPKLEKDLKDALQTELG